MEQTEYRVSANLDQLQTKAPELLIHDWKQSMTTKNEPIKNRVSVTFTKLEDAAEVYYQLRDKKLVAFRNWVL